MKKFDTLQDLALFITKMDKTPEPNDEINISEASSIAKFLIENIGENGVSKTINRIEVMSDEMINTFGKSTITADQHRRLIVILKDMFRYEWKPFFPWSKRCKYKRSIKKL